MIGHQGNSRIGGVVAGDTQGAFSMAGEYVRKDELDAVMFDLGGVLVELGGVEQMFDWTRGRLTREELWRRWLLSPGGRLFESGRITPEDFAERMISEFELPVTAEEYLRAFEVWVRAPYPGVTDLLEGLSKVYRLACISNTNAMHWPRMRDHMGLGRFFERSFVSHETGLVKPDREAFLHAMAGLGCPAERILYFDDSQINVDAARDAGMAAHRVNGVEEIVAILRDMGIAKDSR